MQLYKAPYDVPKIWHGYVLQLVINCLNKQDIQADSFDTSELDVSWLNIDVTWLNIDVTHNDACQGFTLLIMRLLTLIFSADKFPIEHLPLLLTLFAAKEGLNMTLYKTADQYQTNIKDFLMHLHDNSYGSC